MVVEILDSAGAILGIATSTVFTEQTFDFDHQGIAKLICRPPAVGILVAMDDLNFNSPESEFSFDQDGDQDVDAIDLLTLLGQIKSRQRLAGVLAEFANAWNP
jgi:hypothetical protein